MKKNSFLTFCFAFIPGAGQMYLGFIKRGVSFMAAFFLMIAISGNFRINAVMWLLPIIFFVAFFDTFNLARKLKENISVQDDFVFKTSELEGLFQHKKRNKYIGLAAVFVGVYWLFDNFVLNMLSDAVIRCFATTMPVVADNIYLVTRNIRNSAPSVIIAVVIIVIGIKLIKGTENKEKAQDIIEYKGEDVK